MVAVIQFAANRRSMTASPFCRGKPLEPLPSFDSCRCHSSLAAACGRGQL